ncbi:chloride channel [Branchiostoma belcheri]|nr:chloride channel [Branchiostoma belcheri]
MTKSYSLKVANARLGGFPRLLLRWKASIYKLLYKEMAIFITLYVALSIMYRFALKPPQKRTFEKIAMYCHQYSDLIPVSFLLGFYVSIIYARWWNQYLSLPWPDRLASLIGCVVHGADERGRLIRRTMVRYLNLSAVMVMRGVSTLVYKRFPTMTHIIDAGFMTIAEWKEYESLESHHSKFWVPINWFCNLASEARQEGRIRDDFAFKALMEEINVYRGCLGMIYSYDWISVPLVYTQVVTVAVYTFLLSCLMGRQYLDPAQGYEGHEVDLYVPAFTLLQFFFYMGWLKVAEQLINPFGEDDDDFDSNWCIDRNLQISYLAVDDMYLCHPPLEKDIYWNQPDPDLPYTQAALSSRTTPFLGSTFELRLNKDDMEFTHLPTVEENTSSQDSPPKYTSKFRTHALSHASSTFSLKSSAPGTPGQPFSAPPGMKRMDSIITPCSTATNSLKRNFSLRKPPHNADSYTELRAMTKMHRVDSQDSLVPPEDHPTESETGEKELVSRSPSDPGNPCLSLNNCLKGKKLLQVGDQGEPHGTGVPAFFSSTPLPRKQLSRSASELAADGALLGNKLGNFHESLDEGMSSMTKLGPNKDLLCSSDYFSNEKLRGNKSSASLAEKDKPDSTDSTKDAHDGKPSRFTVRRPSDTPPLRPKGLTAFLYDDDDVDEGLYSATNSAYSTVNSVHDVVSIEVHPALPELDDAASGQELQDNNNASRGQDAAHRDVVVVTIEDEENGNNSPEVEVELPRVTTM